MISRRAVITVLLTVGATASASAQQTPTPRTKAVTVSGGVNLANGYQIGDLTATLRRNGLGTPAPFTLLRAESELGRSVGVDGRVSVGLWRALSVEVGGTYSTADLGVTVSADPEASDGAFATERVSQFVVDVSGIYHLPVAPRRRARPYFLAGGGYLRQLHEGRLLVETGRTLHGGAGLQYWLRTNARTSRAFGVRGEVRYVRRSGGVDFEDRARRYVTLSALGVYRF